jgi:hypothetical protein
MPTESAVISETMPSGVPRPITRLSTSIMNSGVARPRTLTRTDAAASFRITGRARSQNGAYHWPRDCGAGFSRNIRTRDPSTLTCSEFIRRT